MSLCASSNKSFLQLNHGADPTIKNQEGQTPHDLTTAEDVKSLIEAAMPQHMSNVAASNNSSVAANDAAASSQSKAGSVASLTYMNSWILVRLFIY